MVGWSRRNRESSQRRARHVRWWATLTEAEKVEYRAKQEAQRAVEMRTFKWVFAVWFLIAGTLLTLIMTGYLR